MDGGLNVLVAYLHGSDKSLNISKVIKISILESFFIKGIPLVFQKWKMVGKLKTEYNVYNEAYDSGNFRAK